MKTLGATRRQLFLAYLMEYGLLGLVTAGFGLITGIAAAYGIVTGVMRLPFAIDWTVAATSITVSLLVTVILGLLGTWRILGQKPAPYLREL
jgi:putative ABC transport system permease protein